MEWTGEPHAGRSSTKQRLATELARVVLHAEQRLKRGLDRAQLARRLNVSPASLYAYLNGTTLPRSVVFERLLDELGVSGAERGRLSTLRDEAEVAQRVARPGSRTRRTGAAGPLSKPRQLPPGTRYFVGRSVELARLTDIAESTRDARMVNICVVHGTAGVGKTTLATVGAHQVKGRFPDGHLHVDLRGFGINPPADPSEVLIGFLHALGASLSEVPPTLDAKMALYRSLLDKRRMLIVLDNVRSTEQVRPLVPSAAGCLVVVTSRDRMDSLVAREGAVRIALDMMTPGDAEKLLAARLTAQRLAAEPEAVRELVELCAGLPLALSVVASRAADRPDAPMSIFAAELRDTQDRLDHLSSPEADLDVQTVFQWSYDALSPVGAWLFRLLGLHPGPDVDLSTCAALADMAKPPKKALRELVHANLLTEQPLGRFRFHDLLRAYAHARGLCTDVDVDRVQAMRRLLDYYLWTASRANARIQPNDVEGSDYGGAWVGPAPKLDTYAEAMAWFTAEHNALRSLIEHAANHGFESHAWRLAWTCTVFLRRTGRYASRVDVQRTAVAAARRVTNPNALAKSQRMLADALARSRQSDEVLPLLDEALSIFQDLGDRKGRLQTHLSFVRALDTAGDHARALEHAERALKLAEAGDDRLVLADALAATARQLTRLTRAAEALILCSRALALYSTTRHTEGEALILKVVGDAQLHLERFERACTAYRRSLALDRLLGDRYWEAHGLNRLAAAHRKAGDERTGARLRAQAITMLESLHHPDSIALRAEEPHRGDT